MNFKNLLFYILFIKIVFGFPIKKNIKINNKFNKKMRVHTKLFLRKSYLDLKKENS